MLKKSYILPLTLAAILTSSSLADSVDRSPSIDVITDYSSKKCHPDSIYIDFSKTDRLSSALKQLSSIECQYYFVKKENDIKLPKLTAEESKVLSINSWQELKSFIKGRKDITLTRHMKSGIYEVSFKKCSKKREKKRSKMQLSYLSGMTPGSILYYLDKNIGYNVKCSDSLMKKIGQSNQKIIGIKSLSDIKKEFKRKLGIDLKIDQNRKTVVCKKAAYQSSDSLKKRKKISRFIKHKKNRSIAKKSIKSKQKKCYYKKICRKEKICR